MTDTTYDVYFRGEILEGHDPAAVKQKIGGLFKADEARLARLFSGKVNPIKKNVDKATAAKYQKAFKQAGARLIITVSKPDTVSAGNQLQAESKPQKAPAASATAAAIGSNWGVMPAGSDLLKPDERRNIPDANIDTSAIKMVSPFDEPEISEKAEPPAPDTSHISVAEVGSDMNPDRAAPPEDLALDLTHISVAETGADLQDEKQKEDVSAPDVSHISLS